MYSSLFQRQPKNVNPRLCDNLFNYSASFAFLINFENRVPLMIHSSDLVQKVFSCDITQLGEIISEIVFLHYTFHTPPPLPTPASLQLNYQKTKAILEFIFFIKDSLQRYTDYGHPERSFFQKFEIFGLGQTNWAENL